MVLGLFSENVSGFSLQRTCPVSLFGEQDGFSVRKTCQVLLEDEGEKDAQRPFDEDVKNKAEHIRASFLKSLKSA